MAASIDKLFSCVRWRLVLDQEKTTAEQQEPEYFSSTPNANSTVGIHGSARLMRVFETRLASIFRKRGCVLLAIESGAVHRFFDFSFFICVFI